MRRVYGIILMALTLLVTGCAGVEPERRAYPLIMSVDYKDENYEVIYGMANLPSETGQNKDAKESGLILSFSGKSMEDILKAYNSSREYYLDLGHVQVLVLGQSLLKEEEKLKEILQYTEQEPMLGDYIYVFYSETPEELMEISGNTVDSLSDYLVGMYKNRPESREKRALTLQKIYSAWHSEDQILLPPQVKLEAGIPKIDSLAD